MDFWRRTERWQGGKVGYESRRRDGGGSVGRDLVADPVSAGGLFIYTEYTGVSWGGGRFFFQDWGEMGRGGKI